MNPPSGRPVRFYQYSSRHGSRQEKEEMPVSTGDWILTLLVLGIPILNIVLYIYWALSDSTAPSKKNYCKACILLFFIAVVLWILFAVLFGSVAVMMSPHR